MFTASCSVNALVMSRRGARGSATDARRTRRYTPEIACRRPAGLPRRPAHRAVLPDTEGGSVMTGPPRPPATPPHAPTTPLPPPPPPTHRPAQTTPPPPASTDIWSSVVFFFSPLT